MGLYRAMVRCYLSKARARCTRVMHVVYIHCGNACASACVRNFKGSVLLAQKADDVHVPALVLTLLW